MAGGDPGKALEFERLPLVDYWAALSYKIDQQQRMAKVNGKTPG